jgi:hypothetical protein
MHGVMMPAPPFVLQCAEKVTPGRMVYVIITELGRVLLPMAPRQSAEEQEAPCAS